MRPCHRLTATVLIAILTAVSSLSAGCTSMRTVAHVNGPTPPPAFRKIEPGDRVAVQMRDGRREEFEVARIDGDALVSRAGARYQRTDMVLLTHENISQRRVWIIVGSTIGGVGVLVLLLLAGGGLGIQLM